MAAEYELTQLRVDLPDGRDLYLRQSPQIYKQVLVLSGVDRYFGFAPCFRFEAGDSTHLRSFVQLDVEMLSGSEAEVRSIAEECIHRLCDRMSVSHERPFPQLSAGVAVERYGTTSPDLRTRDDEHAFVWIVDFPMVAEDERAGRLEPTRHVFAQPTGDIAGAASLDDLRGVGTRSFDLVHNGIEIGGGNMRIHDPEQLARAVKLLGLRADQFELSRRALALRGQPHGGFAFGLERLVMALTGEPLIDRVSAFPDSLL